MTRKNIKHDELKNFAELILTADDYNQVIQRLNGKRMGTTNIDMELPTKKRRLNALKELIEVYK